jgi:5-methylcytosine-specific restriction endonuclease McrA
LRGIHKRRVRMRRLVATLTSDEWEAIKKSQENRCGICLKNKKLTRDHIIPLSKGGQHIKENIQALCRSCNSRKGNRIMGFQG